MSCEGGRGEAGFDSLLLLLLLLLGSEKAVWKRRMFRRIESKVEEGMSFSIRFLKEKKKKKGVPSHH